MDYNKNEILNAILESKKLIGKEFKKIYGDGDSSEKIVELLKTIEIGNHVIQKQITY